MPLEDDFTDIIKKARMGLGLSNEDVALGAGLGTRDQTALERGERRPTVHEVEAIGSVLKLRPKPLVDIAHGQWAPKAPAASVTEGELGVETVLGDIGGYAVKG